MPLWTKNDTESGKPKYLTAAEKAKTYLVDETEAQQEANRAIGIQNQGWVMYSTYTDSDGNTRHRSETLVAMGDTTGVGDEANDSIIVNATITILTHPTDYTANTSIANTALFVVSADISPAGGTLTYEWQARDGANSSAAFIAVSNTTIYSDFDTANLTINEVSGLDGWEYRVVVGSTEAASVTSTSAVLTVE